MSPLPSHDPKRFEDAASKPETRGIELIPASQRHGKARSQFWVWAAPNASFLTFTMGGVMIAALGLTIGQALLVIVLAALGWILTGIIAVSGPAAGTSGSVITRAIYGIVGNKIVVGLYGWLLAAVYLALTWSAASVNGLGLLRSFGVESTTALGVVVAIVVAAITVVVAVYGHGLIVKTYPYISNFLVVVFIVATFYMAPHFDFSYEPAQPLSGGNLAAAITIGFTMLISTPLSFINSPDMARYLPQDTAPWRIAGAVALGGGLVGIVFTSIGALIATAVDYDPAGGLMGAFEQHLPGWFFPIFTIAVIVAAIALNGMTTYSASLALQSLGIPIRRIPSAMIIAVIGTLLTIVSVAIYDFTSSVSVMLQLVVVASAPLIAVYAADVIARRNDYDGFGLLDDSSTSPFWFRRGWNWAGLLALLIGGASSALCISTDIYVGPISAVTGLDLSIPAGVLVSVVVYLLLSRTALVKHVD